MRGESQNYNNYVIYKIKYSCVPDSLSFQTFKTRAIRVLQDL